jgi:hypothetical protein
VASGPPPLPSPLKARYLARYNGNQATPHLFVKAAVRYKVGTATTDESVHTLGFRLDPNVGPVESLAGSSVELDETAMSDMPPSALALSYGSLPAYVSTDGARAIERALKERLDDQFAVDLLYDAQTKLLSRPGESAEAFALRIQGSLPGTTKRRSIETKLQAKRATLESKQNEVKARGFEKWASLGTSILSNMGIFTGKKRTVTGVGGVLSKQRMESTARSTTERLQKEVADLEQQLEELSIVDPGRFEHRTVRPMRGDLTIIRYDIVWVY